MRLLYKLARSMRKNASPCSSSDCMANSQPNAAVQRVCICSFKMRHKSLRTRSRPLSVWRYRCSGMEASAPESKPTQAYTVPCESAAVSDKGLP